MEEYEEGEREEEEVAGASGNPGPGASLLCIEYPGFVVRQA